MSAATSIDQGAPNLNLTPEEKRIYNQLFRQADTEGVNVVTGDVAVRFFEKTRLESRVLGEIWQIADKENRGFLTPAGFGIVLRLIGHAQAGREPTPEMALHPGPIPRFEGMMPPTSPSQPPLQPQSSGGAGRIPPLTPDKVAQYSGLFERQNLQGNFLPGEQARSIFDKSGLPNDTLGRIWGLADTEQRGALALPEFVIAMHLLTSMKGGVLRQLPSVLPPGLYEAATRGPSAAPRQSPNNTGLASIPRQLSGSAQQRTGSPLGRPPLVAQAPPPPPVQSSNLNNSTSTNNNDWLVSAADKARFDHIYADIDKDKKGYITGEQAVPFLSQSNLPEDSLAQIWDLADFTSQGRLTREGFAVAMYLIRQQRSNRGAPLPAVLPPNLIPPSQRGLIRPAGAAAPLSTFDPPPGTQPPPAPPKSALDDLFGLDSSAPSPTPPAPAQTTMSTGGSNAIDPFASGSSVLHPSSPLAKTAAPTIAPSAATTFKPFAPTSSFGRGLAGQAGSEPPVQRAISEDLLGDNDADAHKKISADTAELANLSNQISSLAKQTEEIQAKRTTTQNDLHQTNSQKQNFEQRLTQLRQQYEKEAQDTRALEEQLRISRAETQKLQEESMKLQFQTKDIQAQHQQVLTALQADQQENNNLKEQIRVANAEIAQLKPQIEKLKSEARQHKGLVAINKKQLATVEGEREKLKGEVDSLHKAADEYSRQLETGSPVSVSAQVASPTPSTASGNNPFFKRTASTDILGVFGAQPARTFSDKSFDDLFGPAGPSTSNGTPPMTAFKQQHTGQSQASVGSFSNLSASTPNITRQSTLTAEPPAAPEPRQFSSATLPFPDHSESLSSSRQVSPPTSRAEGSAIGAYPFPGPAVIAPEISKSPVPVSSSEEMDKHDSASATPVPGAQRDGSPQAAEEGSHSAGVSGSFEPTDNAKAKADFDNAFAAFASTKAPAPEAVKPAGGFDSEFPPISELERDDSDSDSDKGGFDDDFAPTSPEAKLKEQKEETRPVAQDAELPKDIFAEREPVDSKSAELPSSPATITHNNVPATSQASTADDIFGSGTLTATTQHIMSSQATKGAFDDLEDDFEGLEDAKEGSADDDFATISRSGLDDYNPMFDSSPPPSQAKSESTAFGNESSFDFISSNSATSGSAVVSGQQKAESHDWDAIFSGLDSPRTATPPAHHTTATAPEEDAAATRPPAPGRALTEGGEHDDPILKSLVNMGYSRSTALSALEKYDYNLERAANHLANQS